jgi:hypothetical protein
LPLPLMHNRFCTIPDSQHPTGIRSGHSWVVVEIENGRGVRVGLKIPLSPCNASRSALSSSSVDRSEATTPSGLDPTTQRSKSNDR